MSSENYIYYPLKKFIERYKAEKNTRLHMPGHKGAFDYGDDITEIKGADSLYEASGIIADSENRTAKMFGAANSFYSTEGSSQVIKAMCFLAVQRQCNQDSSKNCPTILATRNAHKSFIYASMLLGFDIKWMVDGDEFSLCKCYVTPERLEKYLKETEGANVAAVYVTSPDYLGNILDIKGLSKVAHKYGLPILVDNAHGSYLKFMKNDIHPVSLGADLVADSAHKTLPVMTGGAYLHISRNSMFLKASSISGNGENKQSVSMISEEYAKEIRKALLMFGSTSPSYVIMESLDEALGRIDVKEYRKTQDRVDVLKHELIKMGYCISGIGSGLSGEPLKIVVDLRMEKISGIQLSNMLREHGIECEYEDPDFLVTMWSPFNEYPADFDKFKNAMAEIKRNVGIGEEAKKSLDTEKINSGKASLINFSLPKVEYQPREIMYCVHRLEKVGPGLVGKVAADTVVSCPPAVSPIVAGEVIDENIVKVLEYYGIESVEVLI